MTEPPTEGGTRRPAWSVGDLLLVILGGLAAAFAAALLVPVVEDTATVYAVSVVAQPLGYLAALWVVVRRRGARFADLGLDVRPTDGLYVLAGAALQVGIALAFLPLENLIQPEGSPQALVQDLPSLQGSAVRASLALALVLIAPVAEELMFRGLVLQMAERSRGRRFALVVSALGFALYHLVGIRDTGLLTVFGLLVPQLFIVGLVLGILAYRHGRLGVPIFVHSGFNLIATIILFVAPQLAG